MAAITTISQKSGVRYRVTIDMPGVRTFSRSFKAKKNARAWAKKTEGSLEEARVQGNNLARNLTLSTLITELSSSGTLNKATVGALKWWKENYGHELCLLLNKTVIRDALKSLSEGQARVGNGKGKSKATTKRRTPATINRYKASLSSVFEYGREHYDLPGNPCREIKALPVPRGRVRWLDDDEKKALLKACKCSDWPLLYPDTPYLFVTERKGPLTASTVRKMVARAGIKAKIKFPVHPHMLRHGCGFKLANEGHDTRSIQHYMGHKNIQHTVRYTELSPDRFNGFFKD